MQLFSSSAKLECGGGKESPGNARPAFCCIQSKPEQEECQVSNSTVICQYHLFFLYHDLPLPTLSFAIAEVKRFSQSFMALQLCIRDQLMFKLKCVSYVYWDREKQSGVRYTQLDQSLRRDELQELITQLVLQNALPYQQSAS